MADENQDPAERVSANPFGVDDHRFLTTGDLDNIAEYVKNKNKSSSSSSSSSKKSSSSSRSKSRSGASSSKSKSGGSNQ